MGNTPANRMNSPTGQRGAAGVLLIILLAAMDAAALAWGADSRDQLPDDHRR